MNRRTGCALGAVALALGMAGRAPAATLNFNCITNNSSGTDCTIGEAQLAVDVTDPGGGQVLFTFTNSGTDPSSLADVYFDDGSLLGISSIDNSDPGGVSFNPLATPADLPGGNMVSPSFVTSQGFSADSNPPVEPNGVNPGESLGITFNLLPGQTFADVLADLANGGLRIGLHVQAFADGNSESFVNAPVPEPTSIILIGSLAGLGLIARRRRG